MTNTAQQPGIFRQPLWVSAFALTAAVLWGFAYPLIKLGFSEFGITQEMTGSKLLFAGIRFLISGLIILAIAGKTHRPFSLRKRTDGWFILVYSLLNTTLHYAFFYFGLSHSAGSKAAILNSLSVFSVIILACVFFKSDRMNARKLTGCAVGFAGILILNVGGTDSGSGQFTWLGDGMIILNALCGASASLLTRGLSKRVDVFVGTGYSLALGGALLILPSLCMGSSLPAVTAGGLSILLMLIIISTTSFALYNKLLSCNPVGRIAIFNSLIPVVGSISSCVCLREPFYWKHALAFLVYGLDKRKARKHQRRIAESTQLLLALAGGSMGAWWGMKVWRHKTLHKKFTLGIPTLFLLQAALAAYLWTKFN